MQKISPIEQILDPNNSDNVVLYNENGKPMEFSQICVLTLKDKPYCILKPTAKLKNIADDQAIAFAIDFDNDIIQAVADAHMVDEIFKAYEKLYYESQD